MKKFLYDIKLASTRFQSKSHDEIQIEIEKLKNRFQKTSLETIIPEWFALVQEVSFRTIGLRHFESQLKAGLVLHQGKIVEMKTGEGKTLASTLAISLNALSQKGVHVVTVNEYLAERDQKWMGKIYNGLGLSVGLVKSVDSMNEKKRSYLSDITYITNSELVFDFLRDNSAYSLKDVVQRPFHYCVIDEIDSILIDEARTPLILSTVQQTVNINKLILAKRIASFLKRDVDFEIDEKRKEIQLTELGYLKTEEKLAKKTLYDENDPWILEILNALKAEHLFKKNKDYIVLNNKVQIVDEFTGRVMEDRRWSLGIHEAIEIKEKVELGGGTKTKSSITYQNFFTLYPKLSGMTGTAKTAEKEFQDIYQLEVVVIDTFKPMIRKDLPDLVYQTELAKWKAVLKKSQECFLKGQPILIGTASVEKSEILSELFRISNLPHQVLNAKPENVRRENEVIAQAGKQFAITIATNMAGRGTDIILGGNPVFQVKQKLSDILVEKKLLSFTREDNSFFDLSKIYADYENQLYLLEQDISNLPYSLEECSIHLKSFYQFLYQETYRKWEKENSFVKELGGLYVLGTERHETRRIDNQLRGRAGRQGDPGCSQFLISLEDDLIQIFGGDNLKKWVNYFLQDQDIPLEANLLNQSLENAQKKVEMYNYDLRKNIFQYDEILNLQRKQFYQIRKDLLNQNIEKDFFLRYFESFFDEEIETIFKKKQQKIFQGKDCFEKRFGNYSSFFFLLQNKESILSELWISTDLRFAETDIYQIGFLKQNRNQLLLLIFDSYWTQHLERMNSIRETIQWRSYGQQNPLTEYNIEVIQSFKLMFDQIRSSMLYYLFNNSIL